MSSFKIAPWHQATAAKLEDKALVEMVKANKIELIT